MEKPTWARRPESRTEKQDLKPPFKEPRQGVHREWDPKGHEEKYRAVIEWGPPR